MLRPIINKLLLSILSLLMILPVANIFIFPKMIEPLKGWIVLAKKPDISSSTWFDKSFQSGFEDYINDNIGLRPFFVRVRNQTVFSLFGEAKAAGVVRGTDGYLYEQGYIDTYNGTDFIGEAVISAKAKQLRAFQDTLAGMGKSFLVCLAAGKGSFYPEHFPKEYQNKASDSTNYKFYRKELLSHGVNMSDFNKWFSEIKDTSSCMLYPKYGIHWSHYASLLVADSIIRKVEDMRNIDMPNILFTGIEHSSSLRYSDYDIAGGMNLLYQMKSDPMCYPNYRWQADEGSVKPKTIVVADSFYWDMFNEGIANNAFSCGGFWFYNEGVYPDSFNSESTVLAKDLDVRARIEDTDVIILMATEATLARFDWGFLDLAWGALRK